MIRVRCPFVNADGTAERTGPDEVRVHMAGRSSTWSLSAFLGVFQEVVDGRVGPVQDPDFLDENRG